MSEEIVRRPDRASGGITKEEEAQIKVHADMWIKRIMRTDPIEPEKIIPAIKGLYKVSDLKEPIVVVTSSPLSMALAGGLAKTWFEKGSSTFDFGSQTPAIHPSEWNNIAKSVWKACFEAIDVAAPHEESIQADSLKDWLWKFAAAFCLDTSKARENLLNWKEMYQGGNMWGQNDSYLTAMRDIIGLDLPEHKPYKFWEECAIHGGFRYMHEKFCIVSDFPEFIRIDQDNQPHCDTGPSHRWRDGTEFFYWHGHKIPGEWLENPPEPADALRIENIEMRRVACEITGWEKILTILGARVIDEDTPLIGTLLECELPDSESGPELFLKVRCATGRWFVIPISGIPGSEDVKTALEANALTYNIDPAIVKNTEVRT